MLPSEAMRFILNGAGKVFDPVLARLFVQVLGYYPVGSILELDTGDVAVVTTPGERDAARPEVKVVRSRNGLPAVPYVVRLEEARERQIVRELDPTEATLDVAAHL
jgi:hypothetical protein